MATYALPAHQVIGNQLNFTAWLNNLRNNNIGVLTNAGAPTNGTSGTFAGKAGPGCLLIDVTNKILYVNAGTKASPVWVSTLSGQQAKSNFSTAQATGFAADTYLLGSSIAAPTTGFVAGQRYQCKFDMVKTAAGTAAFTATLRIGTLGTVADASIASLAFAVGTAAVDSGIFIVDAYFRTVGSGTSAVVVAEITCNHALAATGLITTGAAGFGQISAVSSGFDSTIASTIIGLSINGGASFAGTNNYVESSLTSY
jgi:hypothetical protein